MNFKKNWKKAATLFLAGALAFSMVGCTNNSDNDAKTIAVVAKGESHAFWQSVKAGAVEAGEKYGYNITFRGPASSCHYPFFLIFPAVAGAGRGAR